MLLKFLFICMWTSTATWGTSIPHMVPKRVREDELCALPKLRYFDPSEDDTSKPKVHLRLLGNRRKHLNQHHEFHVFTQEEPSGSTQPAAKRKCLEIGKNWGEGELDSFQT
ncbi:hypothetical protein PGT21_018402 [Puccinia graminis f. sp. tritici]|uniref:Uncharacterized protein n=1 Tax=Puccinia graminis f. sp. tritici TaxID=56615 RepID=A0A5B0M4M9_PUCGR|nr:hypothetical protein PGT21_018402 [Puccinia graminis f. sp. tritici]